MTAKKIVPCLFLKKGQAVQGLKEEQLFEDGDPLRLTRQYRDDGADELLLFDLSAGDWEHEQAIETVKEICAQAEVPVLCGGNIRRLEDVKKLLYAGVSRVFLNFSRESARPLLKEAGERFGRGKLAVSILSPADYLDNRDLIEDWASEVILMNSSWTEGIDEEIHLPVCVYTKADSEEQTAELLKHPAVAAVSNSRLSASLCDRMEIKRHCREAGIEMDGLVSTLPWESFRLNEQELLPVIVQDYKTDEVLMMAYMNRESFQKTLDSGRMTYWSRSRQQLWVKGETSGHYQYVKELAIDCDRDTMLAKVSQIGAACHTGNRTCFFQKLAEKAYDDTNPLRVFQNVYDVILDRKIHPREGSYTNYLFEKGIDKILKKVGEECTEIVIAAKNPDKEELKYEISDFLYHVMVLMAEKGVTWDEITRELARR